MANGKVYLKPNVVAEPLINRWYAWSSLVAPATAAMFVANSHLKIMRSFVAAPQVHVNALKSPAMRGGPFINYDASKAPDIKQLIESTLREQAPLLELAKAIQGVNDMVAAEADGSSLEPLYAKTPEPLRGYVEYVYDLDSKAGVRFIEGLLYKSEYYMESSQSVALSLCEGDDRPFALSTPQLPRAGRLEVRLPFRSEALDLLFKAKTEPQPLGLVAEALGLGGEEADLLPTFFTEREPRAGRRYDGAGVRVRYFGHACVLIETRDVSVLLDPLVSYETGGEGIPRYTYGDLPDRIDYVLITHNHQDHCMFETLLQLRHKIEHVVVPKNNGGGLADPSLKLVLQNSGFKRVSELDEMETLPVEGGEIMGLPFLGEHADLNIRTKLAHLVRLQGRTILCAADSNNLEPRLYQHIHRLIGDIDLLFLGMECDGGPLSWLYGPLLTKPIGRKHDQSRRLNGSNYDRGAEMVNLLNPRQVYVYAMGQEPWLTFLTSIQYTEESRPIVDSNRLVEECRGRGKSSERLYGRKEISL
ncbi:MAG TPA: MBL fold metallo-hydrolase [Pyrinomonadaceae bacterium]|nr:MBL fold metallo-hydrolase [Pyrinomonadaceae bacterium]